MSKKNGLNTELLENGMTLQTNYLNGLKSGLKPIITLTVKRHLKVSTKTIN